MIKVTIEFMKPVLPSRMLEVWTITHDAEMTLQEGGFYCVYLPDGQGVVRYPVVKIFCVKEKDGE